MHSPPDALLTEAQAAGLTNMSMRALQAWRYRGGGPPFVKLGRAVRYRRADLDRWIGENTRAHTSAEAVL